MSGFFDELQRRKVYRVAAAYIIVAGAPLPHFPRGTCQPGALGLVIVVLLLGFPAALMFPGDVCAAVAIIDTTQTRQGSALRVP